MAWPHLVKLIATCPGCGKSILLEAIHQPFLRVFGSRNRIYRTFTWADCPACGREWQLASTVAHGAIPAA